MIKPRTVNMMVNGTTNPALVRVTPELAAQWLEMAYEHQRPIRQNHVDFLAEEMRREKFVQGTQIRFVALGDRRILIDGQHRLWAIVAADIPQYFTVLVTKSESKDDVAWIYGNTDIGMRRTGVHLLGALELDIETGCSMTEVRYLTGAINFMTAGCTRGIKSVTHKDETIDRVRKYASFAREYFQILSGCPQAVYKSATRASSLSIALLSLRFSKPYAEALGEPSVVDFWKGAVFDDGINIGDPRKLANRHLLHVRVLNNASNVAGEAVSSGYSCRYLVACFNAWMDRRDLQKTLVRDANAPIRMYRVPSDPDHWW